MKKTTLIICILLCVSFSMLQSQTTKGKYLVGISSGFDLSGKSLGLGSITFTSTTNTSGTIPINELTPLGSTSINFQPKMGYFVIDNLAVGLDLAVSYSSSKNIVNNYKYNSEKKYYCVGPFVRYYIPVKKFLPFVEVGGGYGRMNDEFSFNDSLNENNSTLFSIGGGVGIAVPIGDRITFDALFAYNSLSTKYITPGYILEKTSLNSLGLKLGFSILLGSN